MSYLDYYNLLTPPAEEPVSLSDAKAFLRIADSITIEDSLISSLIETARVYAERFTNRNFILRDWEGLFPGLQSSKFEPAYYVELSKSPLNDVTDVLWYSSSGYTSTSEYKIKYNSSFSRLLFFEYPGSFPSDTVYKLKVLFKAGYGNASDVPEAIKHGIKEHVNFLYENRGDVQAIGSETVPEQIKIRYKQYRIINQF
jgi:uncharacterized phiE125 gp8 family phage protein